MSFLPLSAPPTLLPSPLPAPDLPNDDDYTQDPPPSPPSQHQQPPNFQPIFTLLSNTGTSTTTHHPNIYYVFSDDAPDTDPITAAALSVLQQPGGPADTSPTVGAQRRNAPAGTKERYVLLDMDVTGTKVESAQSMVPDWAVTSTEVGAAPTWDRDGEGKEEGLEGGRGLMLRIEGMEVRRGGGGEGEVGEGKKLEELVEVYERQMGELRRAVDSGQVGTSGGDGGR